MRKISQVANTRLIIVLSPNKGLINSEIFLVSLYVICYRLVQMPLKTQEFILGIGIGIILLASVLAMLGLKGLFRLIPPLLVFAGAGFLGYFFYMTRDNPAE